MITEKNGIFSLETKHTGYYFKITNGVLENLHYGKKIDILNEFPLEHKALVGLGGDVVYKKEAAPFSLQHVCLELSPLQKGDFRQNSLEIEMPSGAYTADFTYDTFFIKGGNIPPKVLASAYGGEQTLCISLKTPEDVVARLVYTVYENVDVITRRLEIENNNDKKIVIKKALSYQLDLPNCDYNVHTFTGAWARERHETVTPLTVGSHTFGSTTGASSHFVNPFFMVCDNEATEHTGEVYGFNLVYSGSHMAVCEVSPFGKTRIAAGVQAFGFSYTLQKGECFFAPEAVLTYSDNGKNGMSQNMHNFVNNHIVRGVWAKKERPVLCNNWEATYFDFTESKILKMAKEAAKLGVELFVLDDGWFGTRNDDFQGLGDYDVNTKKLPGSLKRLADKINGLGMSFGLWFEPEMVNENSKLFKAHPDWAVATPNNTPSEGRNQLVLDLCNKDVRKYIIENVNNTLKSANISYVKWDMNRHISDAYSACLAEQGRFNYEYISGLYEIFEEIMACNPNVLFEACASGGNRFDLGILCYMPQIWTSDDTDAHERLYIQSGTSYGYPQSTMGCHVSASPNHQAARQSPIESRFDVAAFGVLGYELDLNLLSAAQGKVVASQIEWYKKHRKLLQFGTFYRLQNPQANKGCKWIVVSQDKKSAIYGEFLNLLTPNSLKPPVKLKGLIPTEKYRLSVRQEAIDIRTFGSLINQILPVKVNTDGHIMHAAADFYMMPCEKEEYVAFGNLLMNAGVKLNQEFTGTGYNEKVRLMPDFSARLYEIELVRE